MYSAPDGVLPEIIDLYAKHFTHDDVLGLLEFYGSPVGQKAITVMPLLMQEGAAVGQQWMDKRRPQIEDTLRRRLREGA
jgi:hypothetical protein